MPRKRNEKFSSNKITFKMSINTHIFQIFNDNALSVTQMVQFHPEITDVKAQINLNCQCYSWIYVIAKIRNKNK